MMRKISAVVLVAASAAALMAQPASAQAACFTYPGRTVTVPGVGSVYVPGNTICV